MREMLTVEPPGFSSTLARDRDETEIKRDAPVRRALATRTEWRPLTELHAIADAWRDLARRALEPNVFYAPAFALAAAPVFGAGSGALLIWCDTRRRLIGLFPLGVQRRRFGIRFPLLVGFTHPYAPLGTPLVDRDASEAAVAAMLDHVAQDPALPNIMLLPVVARVGGFAAVLDREIARRGGTSMDFSEHHRALLAPAADRAIYLERALGSKRRKELRRQRHRLAERGALATVTATTPAELPGALDDFLALEARGWKGRRGTAALLHGNIRAFLRQAIDGLAAERLARIDQLRLDERTIAAAITLRSGDSAWFFKIAYDETFSRFSPGVQLALDVTASLLADPTIARVDSCATADHPMIDHLWRERLALSDRLLTVAPPTGWFALACRLEMLRRYAFAAAKRLCDRLRK